MPKLEDGKSLVRFRMEKRPIVALFSKESG